jgi:SAM-dependent methyltransferase
MSTAAKWPKALPPLTPDQRRISDEFMKHWHDKLPGAWYGIIEGFNHKFPVQNSRPGFVSTLEIGAGLGEHIRYETLSPEQERNYHALELRENMAAEIRKNFPRVNVAVGDCQNQLDFPEGSLDRVIAVHVLEHLPNLPGAIREAYRLLNKQRGQFLVVIPTEGSLAYTIARKISAEREYKKKFGGDYSWFYKREHINVPHEIYEELNPYFTVERKSTFPLPFLPFLFCNLVLGLSLKPRPKPLT